MSVTSCALGHDQLAARLFYSPRETGVILGISHSHLYRLIAAGKLDARKLGKKTLISALSIEKLAAELPKVGGRQ
jgi:excisionase family DNA binding protein